MTTLSAAVAVLIGAGGWQGLVLAWNSFKSRKSQDGLVDAQADSVAVGAAEKITETVLSLLQEMRKELETERQQRVWLWEYVKDLRTDIQAAGIPVRAIPTKLREVS